MIASKTFSLIAACLLSAIDVHATGVQLRHDASRNFHLETMAAGANTLSIRTIDGDPQLVYVAPNGANLSSEHYMLSFEYFCPDGVDFLEVFYQKNRAQGWSQGRQVEGGALPKAEAWQPYAVNLNLGSKGKWTPDNRDFRLDFGRKAGLELQIRNVHLRAPTEAEQLGAAEIQEHLDAKLAIAARIDAYLEREPLPAQLTSFSVESESIRLTGQIRNDALDGARLIEFRPHEDPWNPEHGTLLDLPLAEAQFQCTLPRVVADYDRLASRFAIAHPVGSTRQLLSRGLWATDLSAAAERDMPRLRPANHKGLGGVTYKAGIFPKDIEELGITAATVNIELGGLFQRDAGSSIDFVHQARTWSFNSNAVRELDRKIKRMTELDIVVSAILLINRNAGNLVHPDYNTAGIYSMGNLTEAEGADTYRAVVAFLAERYSRPDREHGWISHWIVFNEVDYGWVWTNMGETPMATYLDAYEKAMRLTYLEARRFNPTAEVFISLTHSWDYSPADSFRAYAPRALLDRLAVYSQKTGDYHWGVAYHPYPQSLLRPRTWEDSQATASFDTRYITPKNIEVLDAYLHQEHFLYKGELRTALFSEQGYHTPDYSEKSFRDKAAAIAYTWAKITHLPSVETFHYHRWVDHPQEGGLKVGLRTLPAPGKPFGVRKEPAFSVFSALETENAAASIEGLKKVIGIEDWASVRIPAETIEKN